MPELQRSRYVVASGDGRLDVLCEHNEAYHADHVPEEGYVALIAACGKGCSDLTIAGVGVAVGVRRDG